jgi:phage terminase small subunit
MAQHRKPDNVLKLEGTYRADRHGDPATKLDVETEAPLMPDFLKGAGKKEWDRVAGLLKNKNLLTGLDRSILAQYCALWHEFASDHLAFTAAAHTQLRMLEQELGFTPSSRGKIVVHKSKPEGGPRPLR